MALVSMLALAVPALAEPAITVTPSSGLTDGDTVSVQGTGFTPGIALVATQCALQSTGSGDCNLAGLKSTQADGDGNATLEMTIVGGPIGSGSQVCDAENPCIISLGEPTADATAERGVAQITFAAAATEEPAPAPDEDTGTAEPAPEDADADAGADAGAEEDAELPLTGINGWLLLLVATAALAVGGVTIARTQPGRD